MIRAMKTFKAIFWPPSLILDQTASVFIFARLVGWKKMFSWLFRFGFRSLPVAAGAVGMGCIGFPNHPVLEVTSACNLRCIHCHASEDEGKKPAAPAAPDLTNAEIKRVMDELARVREFRMLVFTGGEPLMRPDLLDLLRYSRQAGFFNVIATNATLIDEAKAVELRKAGVRAAAVSIDSSRPDIHNRIRRDPRAFSRAMEGVRALRKAGIMLQVNVTAMEYNIDHLAEIIECAEAMGAGIMLVYQLVPVGRGGAISDAALDGERNEALIREIARVQKDVVTIIEPVAGPQYWPWLIEQTHGLRKRLLMRAAGRLFHGCTAGRGFVYIKADGEVWPCPFIEVSAGNVRERPFLEIWEDGDVFRDLRARETKLKGACGRCEYRSICGGCRGRAEALTGDHLAPDPSCFLKQGRSGDGQPSEF